MNKSIPEIFGCLVFNDTAMRKYLPEKVYTALKQAVDNCTSLDIDTANEIANGMKEWAIEKGATHYTHWFQPLTNITAEKHDSFITPTENDKVIMEFSGKELIKGEPDASSFPSGGLRATFEARGYTDWDPASNAFIKDNCLCIPTAFCSYNGDALDKKTPLLRSMDAISKQACRVLKLFGKDAKRVTSAVGAEQEYFLIPFDMYKKRKDLVYCGRTLFGTRPPKGQELDDHYFGAIKPAVAKYMSDLDLTLWELGVLSKTKHNEAAPAQHELAPVYSTTNIATDHNQLTMEMMKRVAHKNNLVCLLHEKPFKGVNGSGKHNNWSITSDTGENLIKPGKKPGENLQFLIFLSAIIKSIDEYQDLMRISVASAGNDHRLGAGEAPPAIISIFLGDELSALVDAIIDGHEFHSAPKTIMKLGVDVLPEFKRDNTDRNRTSPFAFTGNKFEFRMLGSTASVADPNIIINTIVAESLCEFADVLEKSDNFESDAKALIKDTLTKHHRIIFNGNGYSDEWREEAKKRGLLNLESTVDCLPYLLDEKNINLFKKHGVYNQTEIHARYEVALENYITTIKIEADTCLEMLRKEIIPAVEYYLKDITEIAKNKAVIGLSFELEKKIITKISDLVEKLYDKTLDLENAINNSQINTDVLSVAKYEKDVVLSAMNETRLIADELESLIGRKYWPYPTYGDMLFGVV